MHDKHGLLSAPIPMILRKMTTPLTFGMLSILTFNLVDMFFIAQLGTHALAAVSYTFPATYAVNCIIMGIGVGISTTIGRLLGQKKIHHAASIATHGILLTLAMITLLATVGFLTMDVLFHMLGAAPTLMPLIHQYLSVWYLAIPLLAVSMAGNSAIRAAGDMKTPAILMTISGLANGILDPLLIFGYGPFPELGIRGAAVASGIGWSIVMVASLYVLIIRRKCLCWPRPSRFIEDWKTILHVGTPAALANLMMPLSGALMMVILSQYGTTAVAAFGAAQRVESILMIIMVSLTSALTPFLSQNFGAHQMQRSFAGLFLSLRFAIIFQGMVFIMMVPLSVPISHLFTQESHVQTLLWHYLLVVPLSYGFQGVVMMVVSAFNALQQPLWAFGWSFLRLFVFNLPAAWIGAYYAGPEGLFWGIMIGNIMGGCLGYIQAVVLRKHHSARPNTPSTSLK